MVVCTLCSCYPWPVLGLPPTWYKSAPYRSRVVKDPRGAGARRMSYVTRADLGGLPGFGPVTPEPEGELFHAAWEPRALALTLAMGATGSWNIDASRAVRETLPDYRDL
eukprot:gene30840-38560_t